MQAFWAKQCVVFMKHWWFDCAAQSKKATFAMNFRPFDFRLAIRFVLGHWHQASRSLRVLGFPLRNTVWGNAEMTIEKISKKNKKEAAVRRSAASFVCKQFRLEIAAHTAAGGMAGTSFFFRSMQDQWLSHRSCVLYYNAIHEFANNLTPRRKFGI